MGKYITVLTTWIVLLVCFIYPITSVTLLKLSLPVNEIHFFLKILYSAIYLLIFLIALYHKNNTLDVNTYSLIFFFVIYAIRLLIDINIRSIEMMVYNSSYVYSYFFGATMLPCISLIYARPYLSIRHLNKMTLSLLIIANLCYLFYFLTTGNGAFSEQLSSRATAVLDKDIIDSKSVINPITVGFFGALLSIFCAGKLIVESHMSKLVNLFLYSCIVLGISNILLGASRGPLLSLVLALLLLFYYYIKHKKNIFHIIFRISFFSFAAIILLYTYILPKIEDVFLLQRLLTFTENINEGEKEYRNYAYDAAIQDFWDSPIIGKQYVGTYDSFYPHNIPIEVLMALGIVGGVIFILVLFQFLKSIWKIFKYRYEKEKLPITLCGILTFLLGLTSGSIMATPEFWLMIVLVTILPSNRNFFENS